jgi:hypothetical protein
MGNDIECYRAAIGLFNLCKWNHVRSYKRTFWKNSSLFRILRIFILQIASDLSVFTKDAFDISFVNGPGLTSTFPIISVK